MKIKYLLIFCCISLLFLSTTKETKALTSKNCQSPIILVQNTKDPSEDYPIVNEIEKRVLRKSYSGEDIYKRLDRIEIALYGVASKKSLNDRVDALSKTVIGQNDNYSDDNDYSSSSSKDESLKNLLGQLEKQLLNQVYPNDSIESRVARLENNIFNKSSEDYPMDERIERIATVVKAQPSSEIYQNMAKLKQYQNIGQGISLVALILMIIAGLAL